MLIKLKNIRTNPIIGVYEEERHKRQPILINLEIDYDEGSSKQTDDINDTLDYCELTRQLVANVNETTFELIEKLADHIADIVLNYHHSAQSVSVELDKPEALAEFCDSVSVTLIKTR